MTERAPHHLRRWSFVEEWEPGGAKVEIIVTGELGEEQLQAIEGFISRRRARMAHAGGEEAKR